MDRYFGMDFLGDADDIDGVVDVLVIVGLKRARRRSNKIYNQSGFSDEDFYIE